MKMAINPQDHYNKLDSINTTKLKVSNTSLDDFVEKSQLDLLRDLTQPFLFIEDENSINALGSIEKKLKGEGDI